MTSTLTHVMLSPVVLALGVQALGLLGAASIFVSMHRKWQADCLERALAELLQDEA